MFSDKSGIGQTRLSQTRVRLASGGRVVSKLGRGAF
jgi:hypothetical protein